MLIVIIIIFKILFIYSMKDKERERDRGRDTGRRRSRLHVGSLTWDLIPGLQDHVPRPMAGTKPLSLPGIPANSH